MDVYPRGDIYRVMRTSHVPPFSRSRPCLDHGDNDVHYGYSVANAPARMSPQNGTATREYFRGLVLGGAGPRDSASPACDAVGGR